MAKDKRLKKAYETVDATKAYPAGLTRSSW